MLYVATWVDIAQARGLLHPASPKCSHLVSDAVSADAQLHVSKNKSKLRHNDASWDSNINSSSYSSKDREPAVLICDRM